MPTFYNEDIDIDVDDFLSECNSKEIKEVIESLEEQGHLEDHGYIKMKNESNSGSRGIAASEFYDAIRALSNNYHSMTTEMSDTIVLLAKKYL